MKSDRFSMPFSWAAVALSLLVIGCSDENGPIPQPLETEAGLTWIDATDHSQVYSHLDQDVMRCWPQQQSFDCLYAGQSDRRAEIADAPVHRSYYRIQLNALPQSRDDLEKLSVSDGYECAMTQTRDGIVQEEMIWKEGAIVVQNVTQLTKQEAPWNTARVEALIEEHVPQAPRIPFDCRSIDSVVESIGLVAIDTPIVTYESLELKEEPIDRANETINGEP